MIKLQVIGNLGRDCTVNTVNGRNVINFSVAHTERFKDSASGEWKPRTLWVECAYWSDKTAIAQYLKKGKTVYVEGTPDTRFYQLQDGTTKTSLTLRVQNVQLLGGNRDADNTNTDANFNANATTVHNSGAASTDFPTTASVEDSDDLPF